MNEQQKARRLELYKSWVDGFYGFADKESQLPADDQLDPIQLCVDAVSFCAEVISRCANYERDEQPQLLKTYANHFERTLKIYLDKTCTAN